MKPGGKGRPTPKRSEAQRKRRTAAKPAPAGRKEAARARREAGAERRAELRRALREGDERLYPPGHAGPERRFVRQVIDGRRAVASLVVPGWVTLFLLSLVPVLAVRAISSVGLLLLLGMVLGDTVSTTFLLRRRLREQFPDGTDAPRGRLVRYGLFRNAALRRFRVPRPGH